MIEDVEKLIDTSVTEVFSTMLNLQMKLEPAHTALPNGEPQVAGSVGFVGRLTGVVYLYSTQAFARRMTGKLLGLADNEIEGEEMVNDAIGELSNMVVGHIKSRLSDRGMPCVLTIPSVVRGSNFSIETVSPSERRAFSFRCETGHLVVEILIKPLNGAA